MTLVDRRTVMGGGALLATLGGVAPAQIGDHCEVISLWPDQPPGGHPPEIRRKVDDHSTEAGRPDRWITGVARPSLIVRRPVRANGAAVLVVPGGGYEFLSFDNEGTTQADWLVARGMTAFILLYRLPGEGWQRRSLVPLQDAQRAIRIIRCDHIRFGIRPDRIGVLGFSAGGHLAGSLATRHRERTYDRIDHRDDLSARPDVAGLLYPVVSLDAPFTHGGSRDALLGSGVGEEARRRASVERRVDAMTSPTMLVHAADDGLVPPANSVAMFDALQAAGRPTALHIFEDGGHGFGNRLPKSRSASAWPDQFMTFAGRQGLFG